MNEQSIVLISKDALCYEYLPCYGNKYWAGKTPNIDELVSKGTLFTRYYTAAPSSAMSYYAMFTGKYPYQSVNMKYEILNEAYKNVTLFDKAEGHGFECHIIWDERRMEIAYPYSRCYGENTTIHAVKGLRQGVGAHYNHQGILKENDSVLEETIQIFTNEVDDILKNNKKVFLWIHLPHVLNGRVSYGGDIDAFDRCIGLLRERFSDNNIFITADHGNMNGHKGKICYGFDVNEIAIRIPMITPRLSVGDVCSTVCSNVDLYDIIFERKIVEREYVFSDSAYYAQPHRKLAVIMGKYKYIYNKQDSTEELYDVEWDICGSLTV